MNPSELHDKARELLALREKAIRGPYSAWPDAEGRVIRPHSESGERNEKTHDGSIAFVDCELGDAKMAATAQLLAAAWEMVDLISDQQTRIAELEAELVGSNGAGGRWNKTAARAWRDAVLTDSASAADRLLAVSAHVAGQRFALGESAVTTLSFPDGESGVVDAAQAEQRGEVVGEIVGEFRDAGGWTPKIRWQCSGDHPGVGTKLYTAPPASVVPSTHWSKPAARQWAEAVCTKSASPADRFLAVAAHVAGQRYALGESPESTLSHPDGEGAEVAPAPAVPDGWRDAFIAVCGAWDGCDRFVSANFARLGDAVVEYPVLQGTSNQLAVRRVGRLAYDGKRAAAALRQIADMLAAAPARKS